jgi:hypothetical protein
LRLVSVFLRASVTGVCPEGRSLFVGMTFLLLVPFSLSVVPMRIPNNAIRCHAPMARHAEGSWQVSPACVDLEAEVPGSSRPACVDVEQVRAHQAKGEGLLRPVDLACGMLVATALWPS